MLTIHSSPIPPFLGSSRLCWALVQLQRVAQCKQNIKFKKWVRRKLAVLQCTASRKSNSGHGFIAKLQCCTALHSKRQTQEVDPLQACSTAAHSKSPKGRLQTMSHCWGCLAMTAMVSALHDLQIVEGCVAQQPQNHVIYVWPGGRHVMSYDRMDRQRDMLRSANSVL